MTRNDAAVRLRVTCSALLVAIAATAPVAAAKTQYSADPPAWVRDAKSICPRIDLTAGNNFSGRSGPLAGGYNVSSLVIVDRRGVSCSRARQLARRDWLQGHGPPLRWRQRRAWRSTSGSAYVGDYRGTGSGIVVEYHAVH